VDYKNEEEFINSSHPDIWLVWELDYEESNRNHIDTGCLRCVCTREKEADSRIEFFKKDEGLITLEEYQNNKTLIEPPKYMLIKERVPGNHMFGKTMKDKIKDREKKDTYDNPEINPFRYHFVCPMCNNEIYLEKTKFLQKESQEINCVDCGTKLKITPFRIGTNLRIEFILDDEDKVHFQDYQKIRDYNSKQHWR
jgi:predicted RNA-binding Zn-ribbon protein involved in translation (DUF1610 family)